MKTLWAYRNPEVYGKYTTRYETEMLNYISRKFKENNCLNKICVEFGASDGIGNSNTRQLILDGWKSVQIEPVDSRYQILKNLYKDNDNVKCIHGVVSIDKNNDNSYDNIMSKFFENDPYVIDVTSIDVDGPDLQIFESIEKYLPKILLIEPNAHVPGHEKEGMTSIFNIASKKGYVLLAHTGNMIFCAEKYFKFLDIAKVTPEEAWKEYLINIEDEIKNHIKTVLDVQNYWKL